MKLWQFAIDNAVIIISFRGNEKGQKAEKSHLSGDYREN